jgi:Uma2 family endonuclease
MNDEVKFMNTLLETAVTPVTEVIQNGQILQARLISVEEYDQMIEHGILTADDKVELLNGVIVKKMTKGIRHAALNDLLAEILREKLGNRAVIRNQNPIVLDDYSEPEPDIVLVAPPRKQYLERHPTPTDILLIIEIADTTLKNDRDVKGLAYARAGIAQFVLVNLNNNTIENYRQPSYDGYQNRETLHSGEILPLNAFPEIEISVSDLF